MPERKRKIRVFAAEDDKTWQGTILDAVESLEAELVVPIVANFNQAMKLIEKLVELKVQVAIIDGNLTPGQGNSEEGKAMIRKIKAVVPKVKIIGYSSNPRALVEHSDATVDKSQYTELAPTILRLMSK